MPKTTPSGKARTEELPGTLQRSPEKAQRTFAKAHDSAADTYGEGERAHRVAYGAVKHKFQKKGDHWEPKGHKGPSDEGRRIPGRGRIMDGPPAALTSAAARRRN
jgi:cation transport regulator ChaB